MKLNGFSMTMCSPHAFSFPFLTIIFERLLIVEYAKRLNFIFVNQNNEQKERKEHTNMNKTTVNITKHGKFMNCRLAEINCVHSFNSFSFYFLIYEHHGWILHLARRFLQIEWACSLYELFMLETRRSSKCLNCSYIQSEEMIHYNLRPTVILPFFK